MKQKQNTVAVDIKPERPVQSTDVGNAAKPRRRKAREDQTIKQEVKTHLAKMNAGLRY